MLPEITSPSTPAPRTPGPGAPLTIARRAEPDELPELMDGPCTAADLRACLRDLGRVNRLTRGYAPTLDFLGRMVERAPANRPLRILDVGSGGGDTLRSIASWAAAHRLPVALTGVDLNPAATRAATEFTARDRRAGQPVQPARWGENITFVTADVFAYAPEQPPDIILSALFTHHLPTPELVRFLRWMECTARLGWFVSDLHRSARAAFWFGALARLMRWHRFVRHDGPVSIRRAFTPADWQQMLACAGIRDAHIEQHAMNRLCVSRIRDLR
jgi:SAM-dependent methyltransferase